MSPRATGTNIRTPLKGGLPWRRILPPLLIVFVALVVHLPRIAAPFGPGEINAGTFFGPFVQAWDHFGFVETRGIPFACSPYGDPKAASPYLHHPPGAFWLHWLAGSAEWQLRLPGLAAMLLAALLLYGLVKRLAGPLPALAAALALLIAPVLAVHARVSYEPLVLAAGLAAFMAFEESFRLPKRAQRSVAKCAVLAAVFCATWMDWAGFFWAVGLFALVPGKPRADALRLAALAFASATLAAASVFVWQVWAVHAPELAAARATMDLDSILNAAVLDAPGLGSTLTSFRERIAEGCGGMLPFLALLPGLLMLDKRLARLFLALLIPAVLNVLVFRRNAEVHVFYFAYFAPAAALLLGCGCLYRARFPAFTLALALLWLVPMSLATNAGQHAASHSIFRDFGVLVDEETRFRDAAGRDVGTNKVHTNLPYAYSYYYESPGVVYASSRSALEQELATLDKRAGVRFVHCDIRGTLHGGGSAFHEDAELLRFLEQHMSHSVPRLSGRIVDPQGLLQIEIMQTRSFRIRDPQP